MEMAGSGASASLSAPAPRPWDISKVPHYSLRVQRIMGGRVAGHAHRLSQALAYACSAVHSSHALPSGALRVWHSPQNPHPMQLTHWS